MSLIQASLKEQLEAEEKEIKNIYESLKRDIMAKQQDRFTRNSCAFVESKKTQTHHGPWHMHA
eukprot:5105434-Amphidinium_carterae.2